MLIIIYGNQCAGPALSNNKSLDIVFKKERKKESHLSQSLSQSPLPKLPGIQQPLLGQIDVLHIRRIRSRSPADSRGDQNRVRLEDNPVVDNLVDG